MRTGRCPVHLRASADSSQPDGIGGRIEINTRGSMVTQPTSDPSPPYPPSGLPTSGGDRRPTLTPMTLFLVLLVAYVLIQIKLVLVLTLLALLLATVIDRPLQHLERRHVPRGLGILAIYAAMIGALVLIGVLIAPVIANQANTFRAEAPDQLRELHRQWTVSANPLLSGPGQQALDQAIRMVERPPAPSQDAAVNVLTGVGGAIVGALALLAITFYYLLEKALLRRLVLLEVPPESRLRVNRVWDDVEAKVGGWLRGQLTLCLIIGVTATIGYGILQVRFWPLLGLLAGITEIIPIVGPWLGGIPAVIIALTMGWQKAMMVAGFLLLLQLMENMVLVPRVMRGAVGLTPLTVFVAILAGTEFMGPAGAVLAIPIAALVQVLVTDYLDARREANQGAPVSMPGWRWMRGPIGPGAAPPPPIDPAELGRSNTVSTGRTEASGANGATSSWTTDLLSRAAAAPTVTGAPSPSPQPPGTTSSQP